MLTLYNPRQTVLVSTRAKVPVFGKTMVKDNLMALDWHMPLAFNPLMYSISINTKNYSKKLIDTSGVFIVNFMPFNKKDEVRYCGRYTGEYIDKFKRTKLTKTEAEKIECCAVEESIGWIECMVREKQDWGDHVVYVADVVSWKHEKNLERLFHIKNGSFVTINMEDE